MQAVADRAIIERIAQRRVEQGADVPDFSGATGQDLAWCMNLELTADESTLSGIGLLALEAKSRRTDDGQIEVTTGQLTPGGL
jgi:hypothetical protein